MAASTSNRNFWPGWLPLAAGSLALMGLCVAFTPMAPAQPKKTDPEKKETGKKEVDPTPKGPKVVDIMVTTHGGQEQVAFINEQIEKGWKDNKITASERCSDYEFIRRASLDIIGRIAKVDEIDRFLKDPQEKRRSLLVERLLASDEYAQNWANLWSVMLLTRSGVGKLHHEQMHEWLVDKLTERRKDPKSSEVGYTPDWSQIVKGIIAAKGTTSSTDAKEENGAVNFVLAHLGEAIKEDPNSNGKFDFVPVTSRTTRLFLGLRTQCVQCHDHPFNGEWGQHHFWGINAFFRQTDPSGRPGMMAKKNKKDLGTQRFTVTDNSSLNPKGLVPYERRSAVFLYTDATFLDGKKPDLKSTKLSRREQLGDFIIKSPYFGKVSVNRMWHHFFGMSLTKNQPDDFGEHNPVSHPDLLDKISEDWTKKYNHNPKDLIRWICNSRAYGLSSVASKGNDKQEDEQFFGRMMLKSLSPEQLFESLMTATLAKVGQDKEGKKDFREKFLSSLVVNFGDDEGNESSFNGTVVQALMLMNGTEINNAINDKDVGTVATVLKSAKPSQEGAKDAMKRLFLSALNRPPTKTEYEKFLSPKMYTLPKSGTAKDQAAFWTGYYQDIFWAILNSNEFILNH